MLIDALTSAVDAVVVLSNDSDLKLPVQHVRSLMPVGLLYPSVSVAGHLLCLGLIALVRVGHARCVENRLDRINSQQRSATCQSPEDGSRADTPTPDPNLLECVSNVRSSYYSPGSLWAGFFFAVEAQHALTHCKRIREPFGVDGNTAAPDASLQQHQRDAHYRHPGNQPVDRPVVFAILFCRGQQLVD